jgi:hypothetical protein
MTNLPHKHTTNYGLWGLLLGSGWFTTLIIRKHIISSLPARLYWNFGNVKSVLLQAG